MAWGCCKNMDRKVFDTLSITEQINYINQQLAKGNTLTAICKAIGIGRTTVRGRASKINFIFDKSLNKYICHKNNKKLTKAESIENKEKAEKSYKTVIDEVATASVVELPNSHKNVIEISQQCYENIIKIADKADILLSIVQEYESHKNVINMPLLDPTQLSKYGEKIRNRSFNVNSKILDMFSEFCKKHKKLKQQDLISLALLEFIKKYK